MLAVVGPCTAVYGPTTADISPKTFFLLEVLECDCVANSTSVLLKMEGKDGTVQTVFLIPGKMAVFKCK